MGLWLKVHREITGAWRSVCYDVYRQVSRRKLAQLLVAETTEFAPRHRVPRAAHRPKPPRRSAAVGVALLVAGGAAGTYLAVASSLSSLRDAPPSVVAAPAAPVGETPAEAATGAFPSTAATYSRPQVRRSVPPPVLAAPPVPVPPGPASSSKTLERTPTPSASASTSPSASASASPSPSASSPSPSRTTSKTPIWGQSHVGPTGR